MRGCIREDDDFAACLLHGSVLRRCLSMTLFLPVQTDAARSKTAGDLVSPVAGTVGRDNDLELRLGIIKRERVFEFRREVALLVVSRNNYADRRRPFRSLNRLGSNLAK